jgi:hypothetical protein
VEAQRVTPMREDELPERWRLRVVEHAKSSSGGRYRSLGVSAFRNQSVRLTFPDRSTAVFRYAFYFEDEEAQEIAVFTEHCGYHVFPLVDTVVEVIDDQLSDAEA